MHDMGNGTYTGKIPPLKLKRGMFKIIAVDVAGNIAETDAIAYEITLFKLPLTEIIIAVAIVTTITMAYIFLKRRR